MAWIATKEYEESSGELRRVYDRVRAGNGSIDNILKAHSLRPHGLTGHMTLYKYTLHHPRNTLPKWFLEAIGVWVSLLNRCDYCVAHHFSGMQRLLDDEVRSQEIRAAFDQREPELAFAGQELALLHYATRLTLEPDSITELDIVALRDAGAVDGEILEVNQVAAYFAYANRTVLGLGVNTEGDTLGMSPNDNQDPDNWSHS